MPINMTSATHAGRLAWGRQNSEVHCTPPLTQEVPGKKHVGICSIMVVEELILNLRRSNIAVAKTGFACSHIDYSDS